MTAIKGNLRNPAIHFQRQDFLGVSCGVKSESFDIMNEEMPRHEMPTRRAFSQEKR
jgi:hypothetical protein